MRSRRAPFKTLTAPLLLAGLLSSVLPVTAASASPAGTAGAGGPAVMMIKANDLAELPAGLGSWQVVGCGLTARDGWSLPATTRERSTGPCVAGQDRIFTSYASFASAITDRAILSGRTAIFDPETWIYTPKYEVANPVKYEVLAGRLARAHGIHLIYTPQGPPRPLLDAQYRAIAPFASVIELQSQYQQNDPVSFKREVQHDLAIIRAVNPRVEVLAGLATDPGGKPASVSDMVASYTGVASLVEGIQLNLARWRAPRGKGCSSKGCPSIGVRFLSAIGVT